MQVKIERVGDMALTVKENCGKKFYSLEDILRHTNKTPCALEEKQTPIKLNCEVIFGHFFDGANFIQSVFIDENGLKNLLTNKNTLDFVAVNSGFAPVGMNESDYSGVKQ